MKTYPDEHVRPSSAIGFEIDNIYVSLRTVVRILKGTNGVTEIRTRRLFGKWEGIHIWFKFLDEECVVIEPFGDSSRYWIGPSNPKANLDFASVELEFRNYRPPLPVKVIGDLVTLDFKSLFNG